MRDKEFKTWYLGQGWSDNSFTSDRARLLRLEKAMSAYGLPDTDLDSAFQRDGMEGVLDALKLNIANLPDQVPPPELVPRSTKFEERLNTALICTQAYQKFCEESGNNLKPSDRIRKFVIEKLIKPARERGMTSVEIVSGEVHRDMGLSNALPAVCSAIESQALIRLGEVTLLGRHSPIGSDKPSSTIRYTFSLNDPPRVLLDRAALERLKTNFLLRHTDFISFSDCPSFAAEEGDYKRALMVEAGRLVREKVDQSDDELGDALIELLAGRTELECNLIDWRAQGVIDNARAANTGLVEVAVGRLARTNDAVDGVVAFVETVWPVMRGDLPSNPYAESRMFPTMLRGLVDPRAVLPIRSRPTDNAARMLLGYPAFANAPLTREELANVTDMAREVMRIMDEEWNWGPRDMWDVQGFIWETCQKRISDPTAPAADTQTKIQEGNPAMQQPVNLILYGPPGTGKTYRTASEALRLCGAEVPDNRGELMERYNALSKDGRIRFITFHQNFSYEEFVEGWRPETGNNESEDSSGIGFRLDPRPGIFRELCAVADEARKRPANDHSNFSLADRKFWKMGLGQIGSEDSVYEAALADGHIALGWGGDTDWSDHRFSTQDAIRDEWAKELREDDRPSNVTQLHPFRNTMQIGDIIVVPYGNKAFRAVGEVIGDYYFERDGEPTYYHRRKVQWLAVPEEPLPLDTIIDGDFQMRSFYSIASNRVNKQALARLIGGSDEILESSDDAGDIQQFVLVIDEINRANISKVFGELITLIEPDKRLGMINALKVRLPYSKREFGVPANLHIIGTMNTADRSIALLDTALRRRFRFEELAPDTSVPAFRKAEEATGLPLVDALNTMNRRIEYLVDRDHRIGHAFFIGCNDREAVDAVMRDKVIPLLQEYFFDDWNRLAAVLGEKEKGGNFLECDIIEDPMGEGGEPLKSWRVREDFDVNAYSRLIGKITPHGPQTTEGNGDE